MKNYYTFLIDFLIIISSCNPSEKLYRKGDYDRAISKLIKNLEGKKRKDADIELLEAAYAKAFEWDMNKIIAMKKSGEPNLKPQIYYTYQSMMVRYNSIFHLLPLKTSTNKTAQFNKVSEEDLTAAKLSAADYLYSKSVSLLNNNNKQDARKAYDLLMHVNNLYDNFRDTDIKINDALDKGCSRVYFKIINASMVSLPPDFESQMLKINLSNLNSRWLKYFTRIDSNSAYDYLAVANIKSIAVSPEQINRRNYTESQVIEDGWQYVYDAKGNVAKDTLGNDIKTTKYKTITCTVIENLFEKHATINGYIDYYTTSNQQLIRTSPFNTTADFATANATAAGDLKALSQASINKLNAIALPFPSDFEMLNNCAEQLKPALRDIINRDACVFE